MRTIGLMMLALSFSFPQWIEGFEGSACTQEKYHFYCDAKYSYYNTQHFWNSDGSRKKAHNDFRKMMGVAYIEYGLTDCDTLTANFGWARIDESVNGRVFGFNDVEIGWKHYLFQKGNFYFTSQAILIVPPEKVYKPGLRYGRWGGEIDILATRIFNDGWTDLKLGYRHYNGFPSDQIRADALFYYQPFSRITLCAGALLEYGVYNGHSKLNQSYILYAPEYRLLKARIEAYWCVYKCASLSIGYEQHLWGRDVGTGGKVYGGAQIQF